MSETLGGTGSPGHMSEPSVWPPLLSAWVLPGCVLLRNSFSQAAELLALASVSCRWLADGWGGRSRLRAVL